MPTAASAVMPTATVVRGGEHALAEPLHFFASRVYSRGYDALFTDPFLRMSRKPIGTVEEMHRYLGPQGVRAADMFVRCNVDTDTSTKARAKLNLVGPGRTEQEAMEYVRSVRLVQDPAEIARHTHGARPQFTPTAFPVVGLHYFSAAHGAAPDTDNPYVSGRIVLKGWDTKGDAFGAWTAMWETLVLATLCTGAFVDEVVGASWADLTKSEAGAGARYTLTLWLGGEARRADEADLWRRIESAVGGPKELRRWPPSVKGGRARAFKWKTDAERTTLLPSGALRM